MKREPFKSGVVEEKVPMCWEHTFVTSMLKSAELEAVKELLGHRSLTTPEVYIHIQL